MLGLVSLVIGSSGLGGCTRGLDVPEFSFTQIICEQSGEGSIGSEFHARLDGSVRVAQADLDKVWIDARDPRDYVSRNVEQQVAVSEDGRAHFYWAIDDFERALVDQVWTLDLRLLSDGKPLTRWVRYPISCQSGTGGVPASWIDNQAQMQPVDSPLNTQ